MNQNKTKLTQSNSMSSLSSQISPNREPTSAKMLKSPSAALGNFFTNFSHSISSHLQEYSQNANLTNPMSSSASSRHSTSPLSPNVVTTAKANLAELQSQSLLLDSQTLFASYKIKYIGSTPLRRRHTLPMLNWIVTDLLYQSKCDGDELHVKIRNCIKAEHGDDFERLRAKLTSETHHHGLSVAFEMRQLLSTHSNTAGVVGGGGGGGATAVGQRTDGIEIAFQVANLADGQILLNHQFRRIFLFGKFNRESNLFYYLHKNQDEVNAIPTLYVFQATDEQQLSEICVKYNELRPKLNVVNDKHLFVNSYVGKSGITSNCYEVLHIGSVMVSQKRASPSLVDRAAEEFGKLNQTDEQSRNNQQSVNNEQKINKANNVSQEQAKSTKSTKTPQHQSGSSTVQQPRAYRTKRFLVERIDENETLENLATMPLDTSSSVASFNTSTTTLIPNTQSLDCDTRSALLKEFRQHQSFEVAATPPTPTLSNTMKKHVKDIRFDEQNNDNDTEELCHNESDRDRSPPHTSSTRIAGGLKRSSSGETSLKKNSMTLGSLQMEANTFDNKRKTSRPQQNKTMLFIIGQLDICLISTENHKTVFSKTFSNISHCSQGVNHVDHFGIIVREPAIPNKYTETYVAHVFKCQTKQIVNELLCSLKQAFSNAYKANKMRESGTAPVAHKDIIVNEGANNREPYCDNCPMNWFHQLCLDIDGLDNETIFVLLMFRIEQHSSDEKRREFHSILEKINFTDFGKKVDILMILLKARAERMQRRHEIDGCRLNNMTIYDQIDDNGPNTRSTASLTKLEGLKLMAKSSLTNTFESIFKINKTFASNDNIQKLVSTHFGDNAPPPMSSNKSHVGNAHTYSSVELKEMYQRRNTLADCCPEMAAAASTLGNKETNSGQSMTMDRDGTSPHPNSMEKCEQKSLLNIFMKVRGGGNQSTVNSLEELSQNLSQLELYSNSDQPLATHGSNPNLSQGLERHLSVNSQRRHRLYKRIHRSLRECDFHRKQQLDSVAEASNESVGNNSSQLKRSAHDLWKFAIRQQILLNKMNKQNQYNHECQVSASVTRARIDYEEIPRIESHQQLESLFATWDRLINNFNKKENDTLDTRSMEQDIQTAIRTGVPRHRKRDVWRFLAAFRKGDRSLTRPTASSGKQFKLNQTYRNLLKQLAVQQHAIFVDLGRTFPGVSFFAESMGPGQLSLFNLLKAYSLYDKEVEYCQGLSFVAGILLLHMSEDEAFQLMCYVMYDCGLRDQYKPDMEALQMQMYQLSRLLYEHNRILADHLERHEVLPTLYAAPCFLTLFASQFSISFVSRVFDFIIFYGIETVFRIFFALLERLSSQLLSCADFESIMELIRCQLTNLDKSEMEQVFNTINQYNFTKQLEQYRVEYKILQEEFAHISLINSKNFSSQPSVCGVEQKNITSQGSLDRIVVCEMENKFDENKMSLAKSHSSGSSDIKSDQHRSSITMDTTSTTTAKAKQEQTKNAALQEEKQKLWHENVNLKERIAKLEDSLKSQLDINQKLESNNTAHLATIHKLEVQLQNSQNELHTIRMGNNNKQQTTNKAKQHKSSESDDERGCFVYVDAEEFCDAIDEREM